MSEVNKLQWHDAKKVLPLAIDESENKAKVVLYGEDPDNLKWMQAWFNNDKGIWYTTTLAEVKDVQYWSYFPTVVILKDE